MPTLSDDYTVTNSVAEEIVALRESPTADSAARGKAIINFLMQDKFFLALYRSNDAKVRAAAIDKLNKAHYQAYGDGPIKHVDTSGVPVTK